MRSEKRERVVERMSRLDQSEGTYGNLEHKLLAVVLGLNGVENGRELLALELHCNMANSRSASDSGVVLGSIAMALRWIGAEEKIFAACSLPKFPPGR